MEIFRKRPALRWLAPLSLVLVVGGTGAIVTQAQADPSLPAKTAEQLLVDLQGAQLDGLSGTVVQQADLGLPAIPSTGGASSQDLTSLLTGNHTLRVWYAGPDKSRVALLEDLGETDVVVNGSDVWTYASDEKEATHRVLPAAPAGEHGKAAKADADAPSTPQEAAELVLSTIGPSTAVSTDASVTVAGRDAYELVLTPKDGRSLIGQVRVAVDAETSVPLQVETLSRTGDDIASVGFTKVDFGTPDAAQFEFNPPAGTKVTEEPTADVGEQPTKAERKAVKAKAAQAKADTTTVGEGWTTVVVTKVPADATSNGQLGTVLNSLEPVSGSWGSGRVFQGTAFSAVLTDDGRLAVGAVEADLLYDALQK